MAGSEHKIIQAPSITELDQNKQKLETMFPDWDISYKIIVDGSSWAFPRTVIWTGTKDDNQLTGDTANELRRFMVRYQYRQNLRNTYRDTREALDTQPDTR